MKYLQFYFTPILAFSFAAFLMLGAGYMSLGIVVTLIIIVFGDALLGNELASPDYQHKTLLEAPLFLSLPVLTIVMAALAWTASSHDFFGVGARLSEWLGVDLLARRAANKPWHYFGAAISSGLIVAGYGTNVAHELTHNVKRRAHYLVGRWVLALSGNADFAIEHVYGHHVHIGTRRDPATARRGETVYAFVLRSTFAGHLSAWRIELARLRKKGQSLWSWHNQMLTGYAMTLVWIAFFAVLAGPLGVGLFLLSAAFAKFVLEVVNYMEHYGLTRKEAEVVGPEHSWNSNRRLSYLVLYSLVRHSAHHQKSSTPFWKLNPYPEAPELPQGYMTTLLLCLVPPLWFAIMDRRLAEWDRRFAPGAPGTAGARTLANA